MVDYEMLNGIPTFEKEEDVRYIAPAMGLFFVRNSGVIAPIAIQLYQTPGEGNPVWTPNDTRYDWLNAKFWLRAADTQHHQVSPVHIADLFTSYGFYNQGTTEKRY